MAKLFAMDSGPQLLTAHSIGAAYLDEDARREYLGSRDLRGTLGFVCRTYGELDAAAQRGRENASERALVRRIGGELADSVRRSLTAGRRLLPPTTMTHLIREAIEWCSGAIDGAPEPEEDRDAVTALDGEGLLLLALSINVDHDRIDLAPEGIPPTKKTLEQLDAELASDKDRLVAEAAKMMLWEFARLQANTIPFPDGVFSDTYEVWFKGWPSTAPHDLIGDDPEEAFLCATGVSLRHFMNLGLHLWELSQRGEIEFTKQSLLEGSFDAAAAKRMQESTALPLEKYGQRLARERSRGDLAHRRYTFCERPILQLSNDEFIVLRPSWVLERFCGPQLYWEAFASFGFDRDPRGTQLSQCMNYVFERNVDYLLRRVASRARRTLTVIPEAAMQEKWATKTGPPSVCDWVLVAGKYCVLVDATNHWLDAKLAQGLADADEYNTDVDETFVNKKFQQLKSTIELLDTNGWEGLEFNEDTVYVPIVVVPNAGLPATAFSELDLKSRAHPVLGELGKTVLSPGILTWHDLQVFEGLCQHRNPNGFVELVARWRWMCTARIPVRPQTFLDLKGLDRPVGSYLAVARRLLFDALGDHS